MKIRQKFLMGSVLVMAFFLSHTPAMANHFNGHVDVQIKDLSERGKAGQKIFNNNCSGCHGQNAAGTVNGPPLIHDFYNPGHHSNKAFHSAVRNGVKQHHWPYGNMPPQKKLGFSEMSNMLKFIREVQQQNGIVAREHKM